MKMIIRLLAVVSLFAFLASGCQAGPEQPMMDTGQITQAQAPQSAGFASEPINETAPSSPAVSTQPQIPEDNAAKSGSAGYGAAGAMAYTNLTLQSMLTYALQDEYLAHGEYAAILDAFGDQRPFSSIISAEETHVATLLPLFAEYGYAAPNDESAAYVSIPGSITDALQAGVEAEIHNIDMYDRFLKEPLPDDVKAAILELRSASQNHLNAFQRGLNR